MKEKRPLSTTGADVVHLSKRKHPKSLRDDIIENVGFAIAEQFKSQNDMMRQANLDLSAQVQRLMAGVDRLIGEMDGVRTGKHEEAFARVSPAGEKADLPTVSAEAALLYIHTAEEIGQYLGGLRASQVGLLLSKRGLGWAGNGDYQELSRHKKAGQTKFWHREVPQRLQKVLDDGRPGDFRITDKSVLAIFRKWKAIREQQRVFETLTATKAPN